jgi:signal transduction histidine kinase
MATGPSVVAAHDPYIVALSVLVSLLGAYAAVELSERVRDAHGRAWAAWLMGAAGVDGIATWSMHYTGTLALRLPVPVQFDWPGVIVSYLVAVAGSAGALALCCRRSDRWLRALVAGALLGTGGISGLHYTAMDAMRLDGMRHVYASPLLVGCSLAIAVVLSTSALATTFLVRPDAPRRRLLIGPLVVLLRGAANPAMHYTAMAAVTFQYGNHGEDMSDLVGIETLGVLGISIVPMMVVLVGVLTSMLDRVQAHRAVAQGSFEQLRALADRLQTVREEERTRVAREIHDELGQALTCIKLDVASLIHELAPDRESPPAKARSVLSRVDETIHAVRRLATELRPAILDAAGLVAAVEWAAGDFRARSDIPCRVHVADPHLSVDPATATALFRILQETLTNVTRHAHATEVLVHLATDAQHVTLEVRDNGQGFEFPDSQTAPQRSLGIVGMRERAVLLGGELTIRTAAGRGTIVVVRLPMSRDVRS